MFPARNDWSDGVVASLFLVVVVFFVAWTYVHGCL